jgi:hypothetical protein
MTVDPIGPTQLNQSAWVLFHAKDLRFPGAFPTAPMVGGKFRNSVNRLTGLGRNDVEKHAAFEGSASFMLGYDLWLPRFTVSHFNGVAHPLFPFSIKTLRQHPIGLDRQPVDGPFAERKTIRTCWTIFSEIVANGGEYCPYALTT